MVLCLLVTSAQKIHLIVPALAESNTLCKPFPKSDTRPRIPGSAAQLDVPVLTN